MKVFFHHTVKLEHLDSDMKMRGRVLEPFSFTVFDDPKPGRETPFLLYTVPAGFVTDGASIPRSLWGIPGLAPYGRCTRSAIAHDWLYSVMSGPKIGFRPYAPDSEKRLFADLVWDAGLKADGENLVIRKLTYAGIRIGGASHWKEVDE